MKLKNKYRWTDKDRHLRIVAQDQMIANCLMSNLGRFPLSWLLQLHILSERLPLSDDELNDVLDRIKNYHVDYMKSYTNEEIKTKISIF